MASDWEFAYGARDENSRFNYYRSSDQRPNYVDGFSNLQLGAAQAKVELHLVAGFEADENGGPDVERRQRELTVIMPTRQLLEFCVQTISQLASDKEGVARVFDSEREQVMELLNRFEPASDQE